MLVLASMGHLGVVKPDLQCSYLASVRQQSSILALIGSQFFALFPKLPLHLVLNTALNTVEFCLNTFETQSNVVGTLLNTVETL